MNELKLVMPNKDYEEQVMKYREEFWKNNETSFDGCSGLEDVKNYDEWLDFENRLKTRYGKEYVSSTVYLAIRIKDNKLVGIIKKRTSIKTGKRFGKRSVCT